MFLINTQSYVIEILGVCIFILYVPSLKNTLSVTMIDETKKIKLNEIIEKHYFLYFSTVLCRFLVVNIETIYINGIASVIYVLFFFSEWKWPQKAKLTMHIPCQTVFQRWINFQGIPWLKVTSEMFMFWGHFGKKKKNELGRFDRYFDQILTTTSVR